MAGLFSGLETGKRALETHQLWLNTIGHNIANVNTPGYTRQRVTITTTHPFEHMRGLVGTGITATDIYQVRDLFLNQQFRNESQTLGKWTTTEKSLVQIEGILSEPSDGAISDLLNKFWNSWSELATSAGPSATSRELLVNDTKILISALHRTHEQLIDLQQSVNENIALTLKDVNAIIEEIASINKQVISFEVGGNKANDLRDKRDLLIDNLAQFVDVNTREQGNGSVTVYIGAMTLVDGDSSFKLDVFKEQAAALTLNQIIWQGSDRSVKVRDGQLKGLLDTRDVLIPKYLQALDDLAEGLVTSVNSIHQTGYDLGGATGINFFDPFNVSAANIELSDDVLASASNIAAASNGDPDNEGNRIIALAIADLSSAKVMLNGTITINEFYHNFIGTVGVETGRAINLRANTELLVAQLENSRQSVQGVSLDEEMTNMIKFQHAYDAAARIITTMDQALDTVINRMGIVGR